jgi:hypothetical protein
MEKSTLSGIARRHDLDALRAFAMLLGIVFHASLPYVTTGWMVSDWKQTEVLGLFVTWVHGFRMPLFIFVSGYFTQMMWRRRGPGAMLKQRFLRVFVPLLLGTLTVIPLQDRVVDWANARAGKDDARRYAQPGIRADVVEAVRTGDAAALRKLLDGGADPNQVDPEFKNPAIAWAAHYNNVAAARLLIEKGADVNRPSPGGHRPIQSAAFFAHDAVLDLLLDHGADLKLKNDSGEGAAQAATKKIDDVKGAVAYLRLPWSMTAEQFNAAREKCRQSIVRHGGEDLAKTGGSSPGDSPLARSRTAYRNLITSDSLLVHGRLPLLRSNAGTSWHLVYTSIFDHLWFLWYLCWLVGLYSLFLWIAGVFHLTAMPSKWLLSPTWGCWLIPLTMIPQLWMGVFGAGFGPDTSVGLLPQPHILLYYGIFFAVGTLYFESNDTEARLGSRYGFLLLVSNLVLLPIGLATMQSHPLISGVIQVAFAWSMTFGLIGLLNRYLKHENRTLRYLADSAYWLYIAHHPLVALIQSLMRPWDLPALLKWLMLCVSLIGVLLLSYHFLVRNTWIGWLLNGRRAPAVAGAHGAGARR